MSETYYKKVGRRYEPVWVYESNVMDSLPYGDHLISVYRNGKSYRYNVDPALAPLIAAGRYAQDVISAAIVEASATKPRNQPLTDEQYQAWRALEKAFGDSKYVLERDSASAIANAGIMALIAEAEKTMKVPAVKNAYEQFMLVYKLAKDNEHDTSNS